MIAALRALRPVMAVTAGKAARRASTLTGRWGGTSLPGLVAHTIAPDITTTLAQELPRGSIVVAGTNGKTTTAALLSAALTAHELNPVHNRAGANLLRGVSSSLLDRATFSGRLNVEDSAVGLFEADEAALPSIIHAVRPRAVVVTNLFRDQLDRYGELDAVAARWRTTFAELAADAVLVLNADDPLVASLGESVGCRVEYYGLECARGRLDRPAESADSILCRRCGTMLTFDCVYYGHIGHYHCDRCGWSRPHPGVVCPHVELHGLQGLGMSVHTPDDAIDLSLRIPGFYNAYNALAAVAGIHALGLSIAPLSAALGGTHAAFGRAENIPIDGRSVWLLLIKNPTGCDEVLTLLREADAPVRMLVALNDNAADGQDVSWIWDTSMEELAPCLASVTITGTRAYDMAVRLKYAGAAISADMVVPDLSTALDQALAATPDGEPLYIVATYTAILHVRRLLAARGVLQHYLERA